MGEIFWKGYFIVQNRFLVRQALFALLVLCGLAMPQVVGSASLPRLVVSDNGRFLQTEDGEPFFWLGDTAWDLCHRLNREEAEHYLVKRADQGFTVIQAVAIAGVNGLDDPNANGHLPLEEMDPLRPNEAYFEHVDWIVEKSNSLGIYVGLLPTWGDKWNSSTGIGPEIFTPENAKVFGEWMGKRYKNAGVIWILGGDRTVDSDKQREIIQAIAHGIKNGSEGRQLMTFHPRGGRSSSAVFHGADWLDFNMVQSGHDRRSTNYTLIESDFALVPIKPCLDGEPAYEYPPDAMPKDRPRSRVGEAQVRRNTYWALFAGAFGHTYGTHPVWQMFDEGMQPRWSVTTPWHQSLDLPGASQLIHVRRLMESRPFLTRIPDQSVISSTSPTGLNRVQVTRDGTPGKDDATYIMAYFPADVTVSLHTGWIASDSLNVWWYNSRTGEAGTPLTIANEETMEFTPPEEQDWVLVLDDASIGYPPPGKPM